MAITGITIRKFEERDTLDVLILWGEELYDPAPHNSPGISLQQKLSVDPDLLLVAIENDEVVGTVMGGWDGHRGWIYSMAVRPSHRRRGIGTLLIKEMESRLRELGCLKVNLQVRKTNQEVIAFYQSLGFKIEDHTSLGKRLYE